MSRFLIRCSAFLLLLAAFPAFALKYEPTIWPLRDGLIPQFDVAGKVEVVNAQPDTKDAIVYKYGVKLISNYNAITEVMARQIREEVAKNGRSTDGPDKRIEIKVVHLLSKYKFFYWNSVIRFEVRLGDGTTLSKEVPHGSGDVHQDLNGCIAEGVMMLLNEPKVREYLAVRDGAAVPATPPETSPATETPPATPEVVPPPTNSGGA